MSLFNEDPNLDRRRKLAQMMMAQGTQTGPVGHPLGALARAMQGYVGGQMYGKADEQQALSDEISTKTLARALASPLEDQAGIMALDRRLAAPAFQMQMEANKRKTAVGDAAAKRKSDMEDKIALATHPEIVQNKKDIAAAGNPSFGLTVGEVERDKQFAKEMAKFSDSGGFADIQKSLDQLASARQVLSTSKEISGPLLGMVPNALMPLISPESTEVRENIEEVVQRNLRLILGAQFTEKEGERLIRRAYNPSLTEEKNLVRLDRLIGSIQDAAQAKKEAIEYWRQNGSLSGFTGKLYTESDFTNLFNDDSKAEGPEPGAPTAVNPQTQEKVWFNGKAWVPY